MPSFAQAGPRAAPQTDLISDPHVRTGVLQNGMHFEMLRNSQPPGVVSIRLLMRAGSLDEADDEQGLIHFIEHMAFNGSSGIGEGEMTPRLARLGVQFGPDANAMTGQTYTSYSINLPDASPASLSEALFILREIAGNLSFDDGAVDRERRVVLAEARRGEGIERRRRDQLLSFLAPGAPAASRMPIGDAETVSHATPESLKKLYRKYYRPERASIIVAGDLDLVQIETLVTAAFGNWRGQGESPPGRETHYTFVPRPSGVSVSMESGGGDRLSVYSVSAFKPLADTIAGRRERFLLAVGIGAVNQRLAADSAGEAPPFRQAGVFATDLLDTMNVAGGSISFAPGHWRAGLDRLEQTWRSALVHGFSKDEIAVQIAGLRTAFRQAAEAEQTRSSPALADAMAEAVREDEAFLAPSYEQDLFETWVASVSPEAVREVFRKWMGRSAPQFFLSTSIDWPKASPEILRAWKESERRPVAGPTETKRQAFAYEFFGKPGRVVSDRQLPDLSARALIFDNNVRLTIKRTTFDAGSVLVSLRIGAGAVALEHAPIGLSGLMSAYSAGGLERHSADDLSVMLSGRSVQPGFWAFPDYFGGVYATTPSDLKLQLQLGAAFLLHPGYRMQAERKWREGVELSWPGLDSNARSAFANEGARLIASGDRRFGASAEDGAISRSFGELRSRLEPLLKDAPIEIAIVGDVDEAAAISAVSETFGALPPRAPDKSILAEPVTFARPSTPIIVSHAGAQTQALLKLYWPVPLHPDADPQSLRAMGLLSAIVRMRLIDGIRERLGASYAPTAAFSFSALYPGLSYVYADIELQPADLPKAREAVLDILADLRSGHITDEELELARKPLLEQVLQHASSNGYWLSVLAQAQTHPDRARRLNLPAVESSLKAVTPLELALAAKAWLGPENLVEVDVLPRVQRTPD